MSFPQLRPDCSREMDEYKVQNSIARVSSFNREAEPNGDREEFQSVADVAFEKNLIKRSEFGS